MFIARDKIKKNIGEYLLYMFQVEDLIRACKFDINAIDKNIVARYSADNNSKTEILDWYSGLANLMVDEKKTVSGHLGFIDNKINELFDFHLYLLQYPEKFPDYIVSYTKAEPALIELASRSSEKVNVVRLMLDAIYGSVMLKLKGNKLSDATLKSVALFGAHLGLLSVKFRQYEVGEIIIDD